MLLVSHSMPDIEQFCERAILLDRGQVAFLGPAPEAVRRYYLLDQSLRLAGLPVPTGRRARREASAETADFGAWPPAEAFLDIADVAQTSNGWARCTGVAVCDEAGHPAQAFAQGQMASFFYEFELLRDVEVPVGGMNIFNSKAVLVHGRNTLQYDDCQAPPSLARGERVRFRQDVRLDLALDDVHLGGGPGARSAGSTSSAGPSTPSWPCIPTSCESADPWPARVHSRSCLRWPTGGRGPGASTAWPISREEFASGQGRTRVAAL